MVVWNYSAQPMWRDEWYTYSASERTLPQLIGLVSNTDGGLSVFYLVMHAWMLLGDSVAWMRVPAGACTIIIAIVAALIGRRIGGTVVGTISGVLVALLPAVTDHAQEARAYPLVLAAVAGTGLAMLHYIEWPSRRRATSLAVLALAASSLHPIVGAPAVAGIFLGALASPGSACRRRLVLAGLPAGLAAVALFLVGLVQVDATSVSSYQGYGTLLHLSQVVSPSLKLLLLMALVLLAGIPSLGQRDPSALVILLGWTTLPIITITVSALSDSFSLARYVSAAAPSIGILVAHGLVRISMAVTGTSPPPSRRRAGLLVAATALVILTVPLTPGIITTHTQPYRVDDPRAGARTLSEQWKTEDAAVFIGPVFRGLTDFYSPAGFHPADPLLERSPAADDSYRGREAPHHAMTRELENYRRVWLIGLLRPAYETETRERATSGRRLVRREEFGEFSLELWR